MVGSNFKIVNEISTGICEILFIITYNTDKFPLCILLFGATYSRTCPGLAEYSVNITVTTDSLSH